MGTQHIRGKRAILLLCISVRCIPFEWIRCRLTDLVFLQWKNPATGGEPFRSYDKVTCRVMMVQTPNVASYSNVNQYDISLGEIWERPHAEFRFVTIDVVV